MVRLSNRKIRRLLARRDYGTNMTQQGRDLEEVMGYMIGNISGVSLEARNQFDVFETQEIDLVFWNKQDPKGLYFLDNVIPVECKNWSRQVDGDAISRFVQKLRDRNRKFGIIVARNGITGDANKRTKAYHEVANALRDGIEVIIITKKELENITNTDQLVELIRKKLCSLVISIKAS